MGDVQGKCGWGTSAPPSFPTSNCCRTFAWLVQTLCSAFLLHLTTTGNGEVIIQPSSWAALFHFFPFFLLWAPLPFKLIDILFVIGHQREQQCLFCLLDHKKNLSHFTRTYTLTFVAVVFFFFLERNRTSQSSGVKNMIFILHIQNKWC